MFFSSFFLVDKLDKYDILAKCFLYRMVVGCFWFEILWIIWVISYNWCRILSIACDFFKGWIDIWDQWMESLMRWRKRACDDDHSQIYDIGWTCIHACKHNNTKHIQRALVFIPRIPILVNKQTHVYNYTHSYLHMNMHIASVYSMFCACSSSHGAAGKTWEINFVFSRHSLSLL